MLTSLTRLNLRLSWERSACSEMMEGTKTMLLWLRSRWARRGKISPTDSLVKVDRLFSEMLSATSAYNKITCCSVNSTLPAVCVTQTSHAVKCQLNTTCCMCHSDITSSLKHLIVFSNY